MKDPRELLDKVCARDPRAWRELVRRHDRQLREAVWESSDEEDRISEADVDEVLSDFWLLLLEDDLRRLRNFRGDDLGGWLAMLAVQVASGRARRLARQPAMEPIETAAIVPAPSSTMQFLTTADAARYCGYRTTGALRKAAMEGRIEPVGRRGGTGTLMWRRGDLDHFLCDGRRRTVSGGLAGSASTHDGGTHEQVDHALGNHHRADAIEARRLAQEGGRVRDSRARQTSAHGSSVRDPIEVPGREPRSGVSRAATAHRGVAGQRRRPADLDSIIRRVRRIAAGTKGGEGRDQGCEQSPEVG